MQYQTSFTRGQPDDEAIKQIQFYEPLALEHDPRGYCVCTSDGKDSRVLGHLFRRSGVKHFYAHSVTGIDPPELVYFQRKNFEEYKSQGYLTYDLMYSKSIWRMMQQKLIPPMRNSRYCCVELKEKRHETTYGTIMSMGVRKFESANRMNKRNELEIVTSGKKQNIIMPFDNDENRKTFETCYTDNEKRLNPIAYWTNEMVWDYTEDVNLEQCCLYQQGFDRLGCIGCPMARYNGRKQEFERYPNIERLWRKSFNTMHRLRVQQGKFVNQSDPQEWFERWMKGDKQAIYDEMQESLF